MSSFLIHEFIPYVHVLDVERSITFYAHLGFTVDDQVQDESGRIFWAILSSGSAKIMFAVASDLIRAEEQAVLFYMYSDDIVALRTHLLSVGLKDGGQFCGQIGPNDGRSVVFSVSFPDYMPAGEVRVADPDAYCILIGQRS